MDGWMRDGGAVAIVGDDYGRGSVCAMARIHYPVAADCGFEATADVGGSLLRRIACFGLRTGPVRGGDRSDRETA